MTIAVTSSGGVTSKAGLKTAVPSGAVAAQRPFKFARYLPDFGWTPIVIARRPDPMHPRDESHAGGLRPAEELDPFEWSRHLGVLPRNWIEPVRRYFCVPDPETGWKPEMGAISAAFPSSWFRP